MDSGVVWLLIIVIILGVALVIAMGVLRRGGKGLNQDEFRSKWLEINAILAKDNPSSWQVAIMEADKLLDQALICRGASGNTLGERLKSSGHKFSKLNAVWGVHKLRNQIAHEPDARLTYSITVKALAVFKQALKDLGAI